MTPYLKYTPWQVDNMYQVSYFLQKVSWLYCSTTYKCQAAISNYIKIFLFHDFHPLENVVPSLAIILVQNRCFLSIEGASILRTRLDCRELLLSCCWLWLSVQQVYFTDRTNNAPQFSSGEEVGSCMHEVHIVQCIHLACQCSIGVVLQSIHCTLPQYSQEEQLGAVYISNSILLHLMKSTKYWIMVQSIL